MYSWLIFKIVIVVCSIADTTLKPIIKKHPESKVSKPGDLVEFNCEARPEGVTYTWYKNDDLMEGQDDKTVVVSETVEGDAYYHCDVRYGTDVVTSTKAKLTVGK